MKKALSEERSEMSSAEEPEIFEESVISDDKKALWSSLWPFYVTLRLFLTLLRRTRHFLSL